MTKTEVLDLLKENRDARGEANWQAVGDRTGGLTSFGIGLTKLRAIAKQVGRDQVENRFRPCRRSSSVSRGRRPPSCRRSTRFSSSRYASISRSWRSSQLVTVRSNMRRAGTSITGQELTSVPGHWRYD